MSALPPSADLPSEVIPVAAPPRRLSRLVTTGCSIAVAGLIAILILARSPAPLERLDHPEESLERLVTRDLDLRHALRGVPVWERALYSLLSGFEDSLDEAADWYEELTETTDASWTASAAADLYRVMLLAESNQLVRARAAVLAWQERGDESARLVRWAAAAYDGPPPDPDVARAVIEEIHRELPRNWFRDTLVARIADRVDDRATRQEAESAIEARGAHLLWRWRGLLGGELLIVSLGIVSLARLGARPAPIGGAPPTPPWPTGDGFALLVRGAFGFLAFSWIPVVLLPPEPAVVAGAGFLAGVPIVWTTTRYLRAQGLSPATVFGLCVPRAGWVRLARVSLALIALGTLGEAAVGAGAQALGFESHWTDGLPEDLLWDPWWVVAVSAADTVLWTPLVEELAFRGLVFGSLRTRLPAVPSALLSAGVFAVAHGYGVAGFASVLWSGMLWALAYERTRSLIPGMVAHGANNLMVDVTYLLLLR